MLFSSVPFLYYFLPCVLILYFIAPRCLKNTVLLISSLVFYGWGEPIYVLLMLVSVLVGYISGIVIEKTRNTVYSKIAMLAGVGIDLAFLIYFKYTDFFIDNFNSVTGLSVPLLRIALPIGISFYTFQIVSYIIDVYRNTTGAQYNIINLGAYISMFPQLIAGPIVRYTDIELQLRTRKHSIEKASLGISRFIIGLSKKILIADTLGFFCSDIYRNVTESSVVLAWMYGIAYSLQLYFDFSGYSDMAIGLGHILGFDFLENFNYPYISKSVTEFWRRWHMSLGSWFRDYVYIPLGGNRVGKMRWFFNIFVVWFLTGFWHGADWTFIMWGLMFAILLVIEKLGFLKFLKKHKITAHIYVLFTVMISFILFNASNCTTAGVSSVTVAFNDVKALFGGGGLPLISKETVYYLRSFAVVFILAFIGATPLLKNTVIKIKSYKKGEKIINVLEPLCMLFLLVVVTSYIINSSFTAFLYFRF